MAHKGGTSYGKRPAKTGGPDREKTEGELQTTLASLIDRLQKEADDRVQKRNTIETRWIDDLRHYHGEYDEKTKSDLRNQERSQLFINLTRPKTNAIAARLSDMLFPTNDENWEIKPTPVPRLTEQATEAVQQAKAAVPEANAAERAGDPQAAQQIVDAGNETADAGSQAQDEVDEARKRAKAMFEEMKDQLKEANYGAECRTVIDDGVRLGTGIMKGPVTSDRARRSWEKVVAAVGEAVGWQVSTIEDPRPAFYRTDPWDWFPEPSARTVEESEDFYERHLLTKKGLRKLSRTPGFDQDAIRKLLKDEPTSTIPTYIAELRGIKSDTGDTGFKRYSAWEYRGPLTAEDMRDICACLGKEDLAGDYDDIDPLEEINIVLWFCQGYVLKFGTHHLDTGDPIYSTFVYEPDESSIFGYGAPNITRDPQKALNAGWRAMMDNAGLGTGPQIVMDVAVIEPANGNWTIEPRKIWLRKADATPGNKGFETFDIEMHQAELAGIIQLAREFIDEETNLPKLAQGESGAKPSAPGAKTFGGMSILMNSLNVVFRRTVKSFDDDMTVPNIQRLFDWNMQFNPKEEIKGDFEISARGSSVLLVKEIQSQNLMIMASNFSAHPVLGPLTKVAPLYRHLVKSFMLEADAVVMTDAEIEEEEEKARAAGAPQDPEMMKLQLQQQIAKAEGENRLTVAQINQETALMTLAEQRNMKLDELRAKLGIKEKEIGSKERLFAAEAAITASRPTDAPTGGGHL